MPAESPWGSIGRLLIGVGVVIVLAGIILVLGDRIGWLGRLPGDIVIRRKNWSLWFPITTGIILSVLLTIILNLLRRR